MASWGWGTWIFVIIWGSFVVTWIRYLIEGDIPNLSQGIRDLGSGVVLSLVLYTFVVQLLRIPPDTADLFSSLMDGDQILVTKTDYMVDNPRRGELVQFRYPAWGELLSRIIALPGEHIDIESGVVRIDGVPLPEPYVIARAGYAFSATVPSDCYFLLPDRRSGAEVVTVGSPYWGFVRRPDLLGRVRFLYWPPRRFGYVRNPDYPSKF